MTQQNDAIYTHIVCQTLWRLHSLVQFVLEKICFAIVL